MIANEFGEAAATPTHRAALIAAGLVLFVLTLVINFVARYFVNRSQRAMSPQRADGDGRMSAIAAVAPRRRRTDQVMRGVLLGGTLLALVPLVARRLLPAQAGASGR